VAAGGNNFNDFAENQVWTGRLQLHKSRFTTAQFDFTTAHLLITCTIKYALAFGEIQINVDDDDDE